jgi:hypothetical protein
MPINIYALRHDQFQSVLFAPVRITCPLGSRRTRRGQLGQQVRPADSLQKRLVALDLRACIRNVY